MAREQEDACKVEELRTRIEELKHVEANAWSEVQEQREVTEAALREKAALAHEHQEQMNRQIERHEQDRENVIASTTEQLRQQMQGEAQKYMSAIQEQARTAVATRDEQIRSLMVEKANSIQVLQEELAALKKVDGDALTERLGAASAEIAASSIERNTMRQELDRTSRELEAALTQRVQMQEHLSEMGCRLEESRSFVTERDQQIALMHEKAGRDLDFVSSQLVQETAACTAAKQNYQQLEQEHGNLMDRLQTLERDGFSLSEERTALRAELDIAKQKIQDASFREERAEMGNAAENALRASLQEQSTEVESLRKQLGGAMSESEILSRQLQQAQLATSIALTEQRSSVDEFNIQSASLREEVVDLKQQLDASVVARHSFEKEVEETKQELRNMSTQYNVLQNQFNARGVELDHALRGSQVHQVDTDSVRQELVVATTAKADLEAKIVDIERKLGESTQENQRLLALYKEAEGRITNQDVVPASASDATAVPSSVLAPAFELQQAAAEREALEAAFRAQMEQVQRSLSAKTMEAETLKHQLAVASAAVTSPPAAQQVMSGGADSERLLVQVRQLQLRVSAAEEEKAVMLRDMREHILQLARENYDLKQRPLSMQTPELATSPQDSATAMRAPAQPLMGADVPAASTADGDAKESADDEITKNRTGGWLSYVLSPFLTDSDMREIHAESYVGEALKGQKLAAV